MPRFPIPVVLCGRTLSIGRTVTESLKPEYEVIHFVTSIEAAQADLPLLLAGCNPQTTSSEVGTRNYSQPPRGVIFGRGYSPDSVQELKKSCASRDRAPVAWLAGDQAKLATFSVGGGYAGDAAKSTKGVLDTWLASAASEDAFLLY
ncbi:uncharacterized protein BDV14DRAFT_169616 [Aspergillus stella-maris]|uniref:uncharacterized protein n=1 Tax=Aspergillus stella-maris TaxID=1810926 RepID=UPI003CCCD1CF